MPMPNPNTDTELRGAPAPPAPPPAVDSNPAPSAPASIEATRAMELMERASLMGQRDAAEQAIREGRSESEVMDVVFALARAHAAVEGSRLHSIGVPSARSFRDGEATYANPAFANRSAEDAIFARLTQTKPDEHARVFMNLKLVEIPDRLAQMRGERRSWPASGGNVNSRSITTSDLPIITQSASARALRHFMDAMEGGSSAIVAPMTLPDFREHTEVQTSTFPEMLEIKEGGEFKYGYISEGGEKIKIASYGRAINVSFQALANDDLGAVQASVRSTATSMVNLKGSTVLSSLGASLSDGLALFHATHGNLAASGAAPDETTLTNGRIAIRTQKALGGNAILGLTPAIILCGPALETTVEKLIATINPTASSDVNVFSGKLRIAVEPRISGKEWYLFADPAIYPCVKFATLAGFESPAFEEDREFNRLGMSWRVHWHVAASPVDYRGCWKNPGA